MPPENDDLLFIPNPVDDTTPPPEEVTPPPNDPPPPRELSEEEKRAIAMQYAEQLGYVKPTGGQPPVSLDDDFEDDPYAKAIADKLQAKYDLQAKRLEEEFAARLQQSDHQAFNAIKPLLVSNAAKTVASKVDIPAEAMYALEEALNTVPGEAFKTGITQADAEFLAEKAIGKAWRDGKLKSARINLLQPAPGPTDKGVYLDGEKKAIVESFERDFGRKPTVAELKEAGII